MSSTSQQHKNSVVEIELLTLFFLITSLKKLERKKKKASNLENSFRKTELRIFQKLILPLEFHLLFQVESLLETCIIHAVLFYAKFLVPHSVLDGLSAEFPGRYYLTKLYYFS